nr:MAG TPA: hypothetical protein [Caudoviricetes sp.]
MACSAFSSVLPKIYCWSSNDNFKKLSINLPSKVCSFSLKIVILSPLLVFKKLNKLYYKPIIAI